MHVEQAILTERGQAAAKVHGITDAEIAEAPDFRTVWARFLFWVEDLLEMTVVEEVDSESGAAPAVTWRSQLHLV